MGVDNWMAMFDDTDIRSNSNTIDRAYRTVKKMTPFQVKIVGSCVTLATLNFDVVRQELKETYMLLPEPFEDVYVIAGARLETTQDVDGELISTWSINLSIRGLLPMPYISERGSRAYRQNQYDALVAIGECIHHQEDKLIADILSITLIAQDITLSNA